MAETHSVPFARLALVLVLLLSLCGCMLMSGEATTIDIQAGSGNLLTTFVGAEGSEERTVDVGSADADVQALVIVGVESGDLEVALFQPDGTMAFAVASRPGTEVTRSGLVRADAQGRIRYTISARGARDGAYQLFVQR